MPACWDSCGRLKPTGSPSRRISPASGTMAPVRHLMRVDLPAPLSPRMGGDRPGDRGAGQALNEGVLAVPVVADDGEHLAGVQVEVDAVEADHPAEGLDEAAGSHHRSSAGRLGAGHARTFRIHWSTATATITSTPMARMRYSSSTP